MKHSNRRFYLINKLIKQSTLAGDTKANRHYLDAWYRTYVESPSIPVFYPNKTPGGMYL